MTHYLLFPSSQCFLLAVKIDTLRHFSSQLSSTIMIEEMFQIRVQQQTHHYCQPLVVCVCLFVIVRLVSPNAFSTVLLHSRLPYSSKVWNYIIIFIVSLLDFYYRIIKETQNTSETNDKMFEYSLPSRCLKENQRALLNMNK